MKKDFRIYINQILEAISEIEEFTKDLSCEDFLKNKMAVKAVSMNLILIGENVKCGIPQILNYHPSKKLFKRYWLMNRLNKERLILPSLF